MTEDPDALAFFFRVLEFGDQEGKVAGVVWVLENLLACVLKGISRCK